LRAPGYVDFVLSRGKIEGELIILDEAGVKEVREKFPLPGQAPRPPVPTLGELAVNFTEAIAGWAKAGFKTVAREIYEHRLSICSACEFWQADAILGTGKCRKCGCSKVKLWLATSKCPDKPPRW
jgi:hypothetical protein